MEWINIPLELFAIIVVDLDVVSIVRLEQVCKSFQENLKNQNLWKEIALRNFRSYNPDHEPENWKDVALTRLHVLRNMREKKCLSRAIQTKENLSYYNIITHSCSVAGNDALITLVNEAQDYSYSTTSFIGYELVNLTTGERQNLDWLAQPNALLTKNYIVTSAGYVTHQTVYAKSPLEVWDRKTEKMFNIEFDKLSDSTTAIMQQNEDENYDTICLNAGVHFLIVDLKQRTVRRVRATNETGDGFNMSFQLYGKYLAYARVVRLHVKTKLRLTVIDIEANQQVFFEENETLPDWAIADNKVFLGSHTNDGVKWVLKDFKGEVLQEYNSTTKTSTFYAQSSVRIFEHVIAYFKRTQLYFFDINNGQFLCSLEIIGSGEYGVAPQLRAISTGKFILSQRYFTRLIDFESRFITKPVKVAVVSPVGFSNTLPKDLPERVPFNTLINFTKSIAESISIPDLSFYWSICVRQTKDKRTSMIYCNDVLSEQYASHLQHENNTATNLFAAVNNKIRIHSHVNMNPTSFSDEQLQKPKNISFCGRKPGEVIFDRVVLYNESFMNGEWVPVDYEELKS